MELNLPTRDQIAPPPDWLLRLMHAPKTKQPHSPAVDSATSACAGLLQGFQMPPDGSIAEGGRNNFLTRAAGWMQSQGVKGDALNQMLREVNIAKCAPPLDAAEVEKVAASIKRYGNGAASIAADADGLVSTDSEVERFTGSGGDVKNGHLFANEWRDELKFVNETGDVLKFTQQGWVSAPPGEADRAAKDVLAKLREVAAERYKASADDPKTKRLMAHVERTSKAPNLRAMIEMAKSEPGMTCRLSEFDNDSMLLGVANGVLDLRAGDLLPVSPDLLVSMRCRVEYDPSAECPLFLNYLGVVQPKKSMRDFLQRMGGYCLTGLAEAQHAMATNWIDAWKLYVPIY